MNTAMKTILFALAILALVGCNHFKPVGPLARQAPITQQAQPLPNAPSSSAASKAPAVLPTPPTMLVTPGEVNAGNAHAVAAKLADELNTDNQTTVNVPVTAEVSRIKGGIK